MSDAEPIQDLPAVEVGKVLGPGDPGYEFPKEVHNLLMAANSTMPG